MRASGESYLRYGKADQKRRRAEGLCLSCDVRPEQNPATGRPFARCATHRASAASYMRRYLQEQRSRWRALHLCVCCGLPTTTNPQTGVAFHRCFAHRVEAATYKSRRKAQEAK